LWEEVERLLRLYVEALVLKEIFKASLRCAEGLSIKLHDDRKLNLRWKIRHDEYC
jgi:hypothetical protein